MGIGLEVDGEEGEVVGERGFDVDVDDEEDDESGGDEGGTDADASDGLSGEERECECCREGVDEEWWW